MESSLQIKNAAKGFNSSIDIFIKGCFQNYNATACVRDSILSGLAFFTLVLCIVRVVKLHWLRHPQLHQYLTFYLGAAETCLLGVKWLLGSHLPQLEFCAIYLKLIQFILLCHFHWTLATRILHREKLISWCILPALITFTIYFTGVTVFGIVNAKSSWLECMEPHWLLLSGAEFIAVQLFMVAGISITRKINTISTLESFKWEQKRDLWSVIAAYEISAFTSVSYDFTMKLVGSEENGCSGIYNHVQTVYSPILACYMAVRFILPIWIMLLVYQPIKGRLSSDEEGLLNWAVEASPGCTFDGAITSDQHIYKQLMQPGCEGCILGYSPPLYSTYTTMGRGDSHSNQGFVTGILKRTILTPITEEDYASGITSLSSSYQQEAPPTVTSKSSSRLASHCKTQKNSLTDDV